MKYIIGLLVLTVSLSGAYATETNSTKAPKMTKKKSAKNLSTMKIVAAEPAPPKDYRFVPTLGMTFFEITNLNKPEMRHGYQVGTLMDLGHGPVSFQTGLLWTQTGSANEKFEIRSDYLAFPAIVRAHIVGDKDQIYFRGGLIPAFRLSSKFETIGANAQNGYVRGLRDFDLYANLGIGFQTPFQDGHDLRIELSYSRDFFEAPVHPGNGGPYYSQGFMLSSGLAL